MLGQSLARTSSPGSYLLDFFRKAPEKLKPLVKNASDERSKDVPRVPTLTGWNVCKRPSTPACLVSIERGFPGLFKFGAKTMKRYHTLARMAIANKKKLTRGPAHVHSKQRRHDHPARASSVHFDLRGSTPHKQMGLTLSSPQCPTGQLRTPNV